jgi:hypothetical protein
MDIKRQTPMGVTIGQEEFDDYCQVPERLLGFSVKHVVDHDKMASRRWKNLHEHNNNQ